MVLLRVGSEHHSITLEADGRHLMTDVWTSAGVIVGVALVFATGWLLLDPLVALAVAVHIVWTGVGLMRRSVRRPARRRRSPQEDQRRDQQAVRRVFAPLRRDLPRAAHAAGRRAPLRLLPPAGAGRDGRVAQAHRLSEEIESRIRSLVPNAAIFTHIEPISDPASYDDQGLDR